MQKPVYRFTQEGYDNLILEKEKLIKRRPQVVINLSAAREQGDLSENAGYHAAKEELGKIDSRLRELKVLLTFGKITSADQDENVTFGSKVLINDGSQDREFTIVNALEADPLKGKMSDESPIGKALLGGKKGDTVEVETPNGRLNFKILSINK